MGWLAVSMLTATEEFPDWRKQLGVVLQEAEKEAWWAREKVYNPTPTDAKNCEICGPTFFLRSGNMHEIWKGLPEGSSRHS